MVDVSLNEKNAITVATKLVKGPAQAINPTKFFDILLPNIPLIIKPINEGQTIKFKIIVEFIFLLSLKISWIINPSIY